jgi:hypothetical protein
MTEVVKRGRGRPKGSKNKVKVVKAEEVAVVNEDTSRCICVDDCKCDKKDEGKQE